MAAAASGTYLATDVLPLVLSTLAIASSIWGTAIAAKDSRRIGRASKSAPRTPTNW